MSEGTDAEIVGRWIHGSPDANKETSEAWDRIEAVVNELRKQASEAMWWMERANEPDDDNQTKEQYRLMILDRLREALAALSPNGKENTE